MCVGRLLGSLVLAFACCGGIEFDEKECMKNCKDKVSICIYGNLRSLIMIRSIHSIKIYACCRGVCVFSFKWRNLTSCVSLS